MKKQQQTIPWENVALVPQQIYYQFSRAIQNLTGRSSDLEINAV